MSKYVLSQEAENDIEEIFEFGEYKFGKAQAISYLIQMEEHFVLLAENPGIGKKRNEIKEGLFSLPYVSHIIFYRILENNIRIVRVLNGGRDLVRFLW
ncbi:MAG TPA: plasmid stabilization protein [Arenibacter sp.]|nr:plasmid stabilization protein [Arenibacter sp.]|tara:strand:- start:151 stop:444 length:294 start_codon:yes stop_codon:yes gene_type:complete